MRWHDRSGQGNLHCTCTMLLAHAATVTERMCGTCDVLLLACRSAEFCFNFMHWLTILTVEQVHVRTRSVPSPPSPAGAVSLESFSSLFHRSQCAQCMQHFRTWKKMKPRCDRQEYYFRLSIFRRIWDSALQCGEHNSGRVLASHGLSALSGPPHHQVWEPLLGAVVCCCSRTPAASWKLKQLEWWEGGWNPQQVAADLPEPNTFQEELKRWRKKWEIQALANFSLPFNINDALLEANTLSFPNIQRVLTILLVAPVTTATVERSNSALGYIKTKLWSTMGQQRLNDLILLFVHKDVPLDVEAVIDRFACMKPRRMAAIRLGFIQANRSGLGQAFVRPLQMPLRPLMQCRQPSWVYQLILNYSMFFAAHYYWNCFNGAKSDTNTIHNMRVLSNEVYHFCK